jgi:hypothetical protein
MADETGGRFIYIPTHRECVAVIDEQLQEARWLSNVGNERAIFCLIDNSADDSVVRRHHGFLVARRPKGVQVLHLTRVAQQAIVDQLLAHPNLASHDAVRLRRLLLPDGVSYGRGPNLAALTAAALGASSIHRRDSDEYRDADRSTQFLVEMETKAINQLLEDVDPQPRGDLSEYVGPVVMVGTSMFGAPPIDRRDLFGAGVEFEIDFQELGRPGVPREQVRSEALDYLVEEPQLKYSDDFFDADAPDRVEMGCSCTSSVLFTLLPEMTSGILGTDYMQRDLGWRLKLPILFQSRKVQHIYDEARDGFRDVAAHLDYAVRDIQYIQLGRIWQRHGEQLEGTEFPLRDGTGKFDPDTYSNSFRAAAAASRAELVRVREGATRVYAAAAQASTGAIADRLASVAGFLQESGAAVDSAVVAAIDDYAYLVSSWQALVAAASTMGDQFTARMVVT